MPFISSVRAELEEAMALAQPKVWNLASAILPIVVIELDQVSLSASPQAKRAHLAHPVGVFHLAHIDRLGEVLP